MRFRFFILVLGFFFFFSFCSAGGFYYNVSMEYRFGELEISSVDVVYLRSSPVEFFYGDYFLELRGEDSNIIDNVSFIVPNFLYSEVFLEEEIESEFIEFDEVSFSVFVPYDERIVDVVLVNGSSKLSSDSVARFSKVIVSNEDVDLAFEGDEKDSKVFEFWFFIVFFILLVVLFIVFWFYLLKKRVVE